MSGSRFQKVIQVFEHDTLHIHEQRGGVTFEEYHWRALLQMNQQQYPPFFKVVHRGIRFTSFVGVLTVPSLTLEVLPKADAHAKNPGIWRNWLLEMLRVCEKISPYATPASPLQVRERSLLDFWLNQFLMTVEHLLRQGLIKKYQTEESAVPYMRGKLLFSQHIRQNLVHQERFYTRHSSYDTSHSYHQVLSSALAIVQQFSGKRELREKAKHLRQFFPEVDLPWQKPASSFPGFLKNLPDNRQHVRYRPALELACLILSHLTPVLQSGEQAGLAFMFDMNQLYEEYIYRQLRKATLGKKVNLQKQVSTHFWAKRSLRPDMVLQTPGGDQIIMDTKWKILKQNQPADEDLKQIYIYNHYFKAQRGILLYPKVSPHSSYREAYHQPREQKLYCEVYFVNVLNDQNRLNTAVGEQILSDLKLEM